ncbi:MAG TPA: hypothetical protein VK578_08520 [Edaphobacter sp.]|nr:hypothetical protein [Edaphobacter sp.]
MRIHESFARETDSPMHPRGTIAGWRKAVTAATLLACATGISLAQRHDNDDAFLPSPVRTVSTVPSNGDVNPYGVAFILHDFQAGSGPLKPGDILVSNFNNRQNLQGTGTTIVRISKTSPSPTLFFQGTARPWGSLQHSERCSEDS